MPVDVMQIIRERDALWTHMEPWREDWQQIADVMMPGQSDILTLRQPGQRRTRQLYDDTAVWALDRLVSNLSAWITNFQTLFFQLRMRVIRDNQEAARWLDEVAEIMWHNMVANDAPQPTAVNEAYRFYAGMGTGGLFLDEKSPDPFNPKLGFRGWQAVSLPIGTYSVAENASGRVDTLYREFEYTPDQAMQEWGKGALHETMQDMLNDSDQSNKRWTPSKFLHAIYPRRERNIRRDDALNMPWASVYVDMKHKHKVAEGGFRWFPASIFRYEKLISHNPFGFGRGHLALGESRTLQVIDKDVLRGLSYSTLPSGWLAGAGPEATRNTVLMPGAINPLAAGSQYIPFASGQRIDAALLQINERRERILRAFFIDQLDFLPPVDQRTQRTLGELQLRARQMMRVMGPAMQRLIPEFLNPFIDINFATLIAAGELPPAPDVVVDAAMQNLGQIDVEYTGDLSRAQRDGVTDAIAEGIEFLLGVAAQSGDPLILRNVEMDESVAEFLRSRGFPEGTITDRRVMQQIRQEANEVAQRRAQREANMADAQMAKDAAPMLREVVNAAGAAA